MGDFKKPTKRDRLIYTIRTIILIVYFLLLTIGIYGLILSGVELLQDKDKSYWIDTEDQSIYSDPEYIAGVKDIIAPSPGTNEESYWDKQLKIYQLHSELEKSHKDATKMPGGSVSYIGIANLMLSVVALIISIVSFMDIMKRVCKMKSRKAGDYKNEVCPIELEPYLQSFADPGIKRLLLELNHTLTEIRELTEYASLQDAADFPTYVERLESLYLPELKEQLDAMAYLEKYDAHHSLKPEFFALLKGMSGAFSEIKNNLLDGNVSELKAGMSALSAFLHMHGLSATGKDDD